MSAAIAHDYLPSTLHIGDCATCGNVADHPLHRERKPLQPKPRTMAENDRAIIGDDKLDTGMSAREARDRAATWWDYTGRKLAMGAATDPLMRRRSRMLRGEPFDQLSRAEQLSVVRAWHHFKIRRGDVLELAPDARFLLGGKETVQ